MFDKFQCKLAVYWELDLCLRCWSTSWFSFTSQIHVSLSVSIVLFKYHLKRTQMRITRLTDGCQYIIDGRHNWKNTTIVVGSFWKYPATNIYYKVLLSCRKTHSFSQNTFTCDKATYSKGRSLFLRWLNRGQPSLKEWWVFLVLCLLPKWWHSVS